MKFAICFLIGVLFMMASPVAAFFGAPMFDAFALLFLGLLFALTGIAGRACEFWWWKGLLND